MGNAKTKSLPKQKVQKSTQTVTPEELKSMQEINAKFQQAKIALGDVALQQQSILKAIDDIKVEFAIEEKKLVANYGPDAVINLQTGEITEREKDNTVEK